MSFKEFTEKARILSGITLQKILQTEKGKQLYEALGLRDYDMPLNKSEDSRFLVLLIALMSFLAVLAASGTVALNAMTDRWSSGLENKITIEIPIETKEGHLLSGDTIKKETLKLAKMLQDHPVIHESTIMSSEDIQELVSPWIGKNLTLDDIALPGLIAVELKESSPEIFERLEKDIKETSSYARMETHHEWLDDLIGFIRVLRFLAFMITLIIGVTTIIAIITAIRTRLAIHKKEVELLHSMGASDVYISRQFQRHAMFLGFQGAIIGTIIGLMITCLIMFASAHSGTPLIPAIQIGAKAITLLCMIPIIATILCAATARITVLRSLAKMP